MSIFKLIIPFCEYKKGNLFDSFDGLVKGICSEKTNQNINFDNKEYFVMISNTTEIKMKTNKIILESCKLVPAETRCVKCGYITWNNNKTDSESIEDMIKAGYDVPKCDNIKNRL